MLSSETSDAIGYFRSLATLELNGIIPIFSFTFTDNTVAQKAPRLSKLFDGRKIFRYNILEKVRQSPSYCAAMPKPYCAFIVI